MSGRASSVSDPPAATFFTENQVNYLVMIDWLNNWFYLLLLTFYGELETGYCLLKNSVIETTSMRDFLVIIQG